MPGAPYFVAALLLVASLGCCWREKRAVAAPVPAAVAAS
jgi:hypothetical protein